MSFLETFVKVSGQMKNEFENLKVSTARKLDILCNSIVEKEKYIGKKTDNNRTIRNDFFYENHILKRWIKNLKIHQRCLMSIQYEKLTNKLFGQIDEFTDFIAVSPSMIYFIRFDYRVT